MAYPVEFTERNCHNPQFPFSEVREMYLDPYSRPIRRITRHDSLEIGYCHSSSGILLVDDRVEAFSAGDICIVTDQEMHISRSAAGQPSYWSYYWMDPALLLTCMPETLASFDLNLLSQPEFPSIHSPHEQPELCQAVRRIIEEIRGARYGYHTIVHGLAFEMLGLLQRMTKDLSQRAENAESKTARHKGIERVSPALHYMIECYNQPIEVNDLAQQCSMGVRNFQRVFLDVMGCSPMHYLAGVRTRMAAAILSESDKPITQIAFASGYESINTFNRQFKAFLGVSPTQYRQQNLARASHETAQDANSD